MHRPMKTALVALLAAGSSCATFSGLDQHVAIDSDPRQLELLDAEKDSESFGRTPLVISQGRAGEQQYVLKQGDVSTRTRVACEYRLGESLAGNLLPAAPLLMIPMPAGAIAAGAAVIIGNVTDLVTGAAWECPEQLTLVPGQPAKVGPHTPPRTNRIDAEVAAREPCARYAIAAPEHRDEEYSRQVAIRIRDALLKVDRCGTVVDLGQVERFMRRYNVSHDHPVDPWALSRSRLNELAHQFGVTHLVVTEVVDRAGGLEAQSAAVDLFRRTISEGPAISIPAEDPTLKAASWWAYVARGIVGGLPNRFVLQPSAKFFDWKARTGHTLEKTEFALPLVSVLVNFQITQLDHPAAHELWEVRPDLSTDLIFQWNGQLITTRPDTGPATTTKLDVIEAVLPIAPRLVAYTPVGQIQVFGGIGPGMTLTWGPDDPFGVRVDAFVAGGVRWSTMVTDAISMGLSLTRAFSLGPHVQRAGFELESFTSLSLDIGYFIPELKTGLRRML